MPNDTPTRVSALTAKVKHAFKRFVHVLNRVFKPGGWRYLRPEQPQDTAKPDETTEQLLKATEQLASADSPESQEKPRSRRRAA